MIVNQSPESEINYIESISNSYKEHSFAYVESLIFFPEYDLRPHATTIANGNEITGLLDSGSHVTVIGQNQYINSDWKVKLMPCNATIITADGTRHKVTGILFIHYHLNNCTRIVPTLVAPLDMKKPIFGIDFQRIFRIGMVFLESNVMEIETIAEEKVYEPHVLSIEQKDLLDSVVKMLPS